MKNGVTEISTIQSKGLQRGCDPQLLAVKAGASRSVHEVVVKFRERLDKSGKNRAGFQVHRDTILFPHEWPIF